MEPKSLFTCAMEGGGDEGHAMGGAWVRDEGEAIAYTTATMHHQHCLTVLGCWYYHNRRGQVASRVATRLSLPPSLTLPHVVLSASFFFSSSSRMTASIFALSFSMMLFLDFRSVYSRSAVSIMPNTWSKEGEEE